MGRLQDDIKVAKTAFEEDVKTQTMDIALLKDALLEVQNLFSNLAKSFIKVTLKSLEFPKLFSKSSILDRIAIVNIRITIKILVEFRSPVCFSGKDRAEKYERVIKKGVLLALL